MKNNFIILVSAIIISLSLVFSAIFIGTSFRSNQQLLEVSETLLLNETQAAQFLGLPPKTLEDLIKRELIQKRSVNVYPTYQFVPYMEIQGVRYFTKAELLKWAEYNTINN